MKNIIDWVFKNKLLTVALLIIVVLLFGRQPILYSSSRSGNNYVSMTKSGGGIGGANLMMEDANMAVPMVQTAQVERMTMTETSMSLVTKDVPKSIEAIRSITETSGGFVVRSYVSQPDEVANGTISIRVAKNSLIEVMSKIKAVGLKVVSESISGTDVTDQYTDIGSRLVSLNNTKQKFEAMLDRAQTVSETMEVQRELTNLQDQIDSLIGQQQYLEKTTDLALVTISLSTDEFSLPYAPTETWRPEVIFKQAVRSLVATVRTVGTLVIWAVVYSPILFAFLAIKALIKRIIGNRKNHN